MVVLERLYIFVVNVVLLLQGRPQLLNNDTQETSYWGAIPLLGACSAGSAAEVPSPSSDVTAIATCVTDYRCSCTKHTAPNARFAFSLNLRRLNLE